MRPKCDCFATKFENANFNIFNIKHLHEAGLRMVAFPGALPVYPYKTNLFPTFFRPEMGGGARFGSAVPLAKNFTQPYRIRLFPYLFHTEMGGGGTSTEENEQN